jgi:hypothetical protein
MPSFFISGPLPDLNELMSARMIQGRPGRKGRRWNAYSKMKSQWETVIYYEILRQKVPAIHEPVLLEYWWFEKNRRRDKSNVAAGGRKLLEDAMVSAGVLTLGDGWRGIIGWKDFFGVRASKPGVSVSWNE